MNDIFIQIGNEPQETFTLKEPREFFKVVSELIIDRAADANNINVKAGLDDMHCAVFNIKQRSGTCFATDLSNTMPDEFLPVDLEEKYLACINRERNSYKFYHMIPRNDGLFTAKYGRIAVGEGELFGSKSTTWKEWMYYMKLNEKLQKGYQDISEYVLSKEGVEEKTDAKSETSIANEANAELFEIFNKAARGYVKKHVGVPVNGKLIKRSEELVNEMSALAEINDLDGFNERLSTLMLMSQRVVPTGNGMGVENALAHSSGDYGRILTRERDLIEAMRGSVLGRHSVRKDFSEYGVEVYRVTDEQMKFVMEHVNPSLKSSVKRAWRIIPKTQKARFDDHVKKHGIKKIMVCWHGSRTENFGSIIKTGLKLHPDARITGKMFGYALYLALDAIKSLGYTNHLGSKWAGGRDRVGYMLLCAVAYGNPYDVYSYSGIDYEKAVKKGGYDCLHAHKGPSLYADEICVYSEAAVLPLYVVEFA